MKSIKPTGMLSACSGSINIIAALSAPVVLMMAAVGIDYSNLVLTKRALQQHADLAAIAGVSDIASAEAAVLAHFGQNDVDFAVRDGANMLTFEGSMAFNETLAYEKYGGYAEVERGHYTADATLPPEKRFIAGAYPREALKVTIRHAPKLFFPGVLTTAPRLGASGTASVGKVATVAISSRLASLNGGLLNRILSSLLGTSVSLSVMDSHALAATDVNVIAFAEQMAMDLHLEAVTYDKLLATEVSFNDILMALSKSPGLNAPSQTALTRLAQQVSKSKARLKLDRLLSLAPYGKRRVGSLGGLELKASIMEMINSAAAIANSGRQVSVDLDGTVPGLAEAKLTLLIGEPEVEAPSYALTRSGGTVRTAQTRVKLVTEVNGLSALAGLKLRLPLYVDIAKAEATIAAINCTGGLSANTASTDILAKPTLAEVTLGDLDEVAFFELKDTTVGMSTLIDTLLLRIRAKSRVTAADVKPTKLTFSASEIKAGKIKSVSTQSLLEPMTTSLFANLEVNVQVLSISLGTSDAVTKALSQSLAVVSKPLDEIIFGVLAVVGVKVGEADIRVGSARCKRPVLVH